MQNNHTYIIDFPETRPLGEYVTWVELWVKSFTPTLLELVHDRWVRGCVSTFWDRSERSRNLKLKLVHILCSIVWFNNWHSVKIHKRIAEVLKHLCFSKIWKPWIGVSNKWTSNSCFGWLGRGRQVEPLVCVPIYNYHFKEICLGTSAS